MPRQHDHRRPSSSSPVKRSHDLGTVSVQSGQVFWIPKKDELPIDIGLDDQVRGHPCVVLSGATDRDGMVTILVITSLGGRSLRELRINHDRRLRYLPVSPYEPHMDHGILLHLQDGRRMQKECYVNANAYHKVSLQHLIRYPRQLKKAICIFSDGSMAQMKRMCDYPTSVSRNITAFSESEDAPTVKARSTSPTVEQILCEPVSMLAQDGSARGHVGSHSIEVGEHSQARDELQDLQAISASINQRYWLPASRNYGTIYHPVRHQHSSNLPLWHNHRIAHTRGHRHGSVPSQLESSRISAWCKIMVAVGLIGLFLWFMLWRVYAPAQHVP